MRKTIITLFVFIILTSFASAVEIDKADIGFCINDGIIPSDDSADYLVLDIDGDNETWIRERGHVYKGNYPGYGDVITVIETAADPLFEKAAGKYMASGISMYFYSIRLGDTSKPQGTFVGVETPVAIHEDSFFFTWRTSTTRFYAYNDGAGVVDYVPTLTGSSGDWFNFTIIMNHSSGFYDVYGWNGTDWHLGIDDIEERGSASPSGYVRIYIAAGLTISVDNIRWVNVSDGDYSCPEAAADTTKPSFSLNQTNATSTTPKINGALQLNITVTDDTDVDNVTLAHNQSGTMTNFSTLNYTGTQTSVTAIFNLSITMTRGLMTWIIYASDNSNNVNISETFIVEIQNTAPNQPTISFPEDGKNYSDTKLDINFTATDDDNDPLTFTFYINNTLNVTGTSTNVTDWNASDGYYNLTVVANDGTDNSINSTVVNFRLDTTPPFWSNNQTNASLMGINGNAMFNITVSDGGSGLSYYIFSWNGTGEGWLNDTNGSISGNSIKLVINKSTNLSQGNTIGYRWYANDSLNQWNMSLLRTFTVANTIPDVPTITSPYNNEVNSSIKIEFYSIDVDGDIITYAIYIDNILNITTTTNITVWNGSDGFYNLTMTASDAISSSANSSIIRFALDTTPPTYSNWQNNASDETRINGVVNWSIDLADAVELDYYFFAHNQSGVLTNVSNGTLSGVSAFVNYTLDITLVRDNYICGQFWFNDTINSINQTNISCFTVANTPPSTVTVDRPVEGRTYSLYSDMQFNFTGTDVDNDIITFYVYINGTLNITTIANITDWNASSNSYQMDVSAYDGYDYGINTTVDFIINHPPVNYISNFTPGIFYNNDSLKGNGWINDTNSHNLNITWRWYRNSVLITNGINDSSLSSNSLVNISTLNGSYLTVGDEIIFSFMSFDGYDNGSWINSTMRTVTNRVLRDLTVRLPHNMKIHNQNLTVNYSVIDEDGDINCTLHINTTGENIMYNVISNVNISIDFNITTGDGSYSYNISCVSEGDGTPLYSGNRIYIYDTTLPSYSDYESDATAIYPEIGDTIHMNVTVSDLNNVSYCKLEMNDTKVWTNKTTFTVTNLSKELVMTYVIQSYSTANQSYIGWRVWCNDTATNVNVSTIQVFRVIDTVIPNITIDVSGTFVNNSVISSYFYNVTYNVTFADNNLFQVLINVTCTVDGNIYYLQMLDINTSIYLINDTIDISGLRPQKCDVLFSASDDHTDEEIGDYDEYRLENGLRYVTTEGNDIQFISNDNVKGIKTKKLKDRYSYTFKYDDKALKRKYTIKADKKIYPRLYSKYPGHFVIWNDEMKKGNWIDSDDSDDIEKVYKITRISDYEYSIIVSSKMSEGKESKGKKPKRKGLLGLFGDYMTEDELLLDTYGFKDVTFDSLGGTNIYNLTMHFYIGGVVNVTNINKYDNTTFSNYSIYVETVDASYPAENQTFNITGYSSYIVNLSNGSYTFEFYKPGYFNQTYLVVINDTNTSQLYNTFQSVVNLYIRNVETSAYINEYNLSINSSILQYNYTNILSIPHIMYMNSSNYSMYVYKDNYENLTHSFDVDGEENLTIILYMNFYYTFYLIDENILEEFNVTSADSISLLLYCQNETTLTAINDTPWKQLIDCDYIKLRFILEYGVDTYYRTLIPEYEDVANLSVYLIDLTTTTSIFNSFILDDLFKEYDNSRIYITKTITGADEDITSDFVDIENKVGAYLIENHEYNIKVISDNKPVFIFGSYIAAEAGDRALRLYDFDVTPEPSGWSYDVVYSTQIMNLTGSDISGNKTVVTFYNDSSNGTTNLVWTVYEDEIGGTVLSTSTLANTPDVTFIYNIPAIYNTTTLAVELDIIHTSGEYTGSWILQEVTDIILGIEEYINPQFLNWFITILLALIAIMSTIKTSDIVTFIMLGLAAIFIVFGWYKVSWAMLILCVIISLIFFLKKQSDRPAGVV